MLTNSVMYKALVNKDVSYEGIFIAAIRTTGIFCRPTSTARKPTEGKGRVSISIETSATDSPDNVSIV